jgi:16S rRNA processing protein RimM
MAGGFLVIARIISSQGNKGEVKADVVTGFPERFASTAAVYVGPERRRYELEEHRFMDGAVVLKLRGIDSIHLAESLRGQLVEIPEEEAVELPEGHYFWHQILGLRVVSSQGETLGKVEDILETGSNDVYVVRGPRGELLIPAIKDVVKSIDLSGSVLTVELMPGLE